MSFSYRKYLSVSIMGEQHSKKFNLKEIFSRLSIFSYHQFSTENLKAQNSADSDGLAGFEVLSSDTILDPPVSQSIPHHIPKFRRGFGLGGGLGVGCPGI